MCLLPTLCLFWRNTYSSALPIFHWLAVFCFRYRNGNIHYLSSSSQPCKLGIITPTSQRRKPKLREIGFLTWGPTISDRIRIWIHVWWAVSKMASHDAPLLVFRPLYNPLPWVWADVNDSSIMSRIQQRICDTTSEIRLQRIVTSILLFSFILLLVCS